MIDRAVESTELAIGEDQCGFRKYRGCSDEILVVRHFMRKYGGEKFLIQRSNIFRSLSDYSVICITFKFKHDSLPKINLHWVLEKLMESVLKETSITNV